jgi:copper chaperone NosL
VTALRAAALATLLASACPRGEPSPAKLDPRTEACAFCRMAVSDPRSAAQLVAPGEEPLFFDDIGCLRGRLAASPPPRGAAAFVADHRTGAWVRAERAVYTHQPAVETPMGSHLLAHSDAASRDADPAARGGRPVAAGEALGAGAGQAGESGGRR